MSQLLSDIQFVTLRTAIWYKVNIVLRTLIKRNRRFKYITSRLSKMASTKGICGTGIEKLKYKKMMKRTLGIIAYNIGLRIFTIDIKQCLDSNSIHM